MKKGEASSMPSAFLEDELFEDPYTLAEIKADPKKYMLWAAENNDLAQVERLFHTDASLVNVVDDDLYTPLHRASYNNHTEVIEFLVAQGANIHARTVDGWQPFHSACRWDNVKAAKLLISKGADVHSLTNGNNTALHLAAVNGDAEAVLKFLLSETDIDKSILNDGKDTAEDIARRNSPYGKYFHSLTRKEESQELTTGLHFTRRLCSKLLVRCPCGDKCTVYVYCSLYSN